MDLYLILMLSPATGYSKESVMRNFDPDTYELIFHDSKANTWLTYRNASSTSEYGVVSFA